MLFGGYTFLVESVFELSLYFIYLDGLELKIFISLWYYIHILDLLKKMRSIEEYSKFTTIPFI